MTLDRILDRLWDAEVHEPESWYRTEYRQAWLTCRWAYEGVPESCIYSRDPFVAATYAVLHCHPDLVWFKILANRESRLGKEFQQWYDAAGNLRPDLPKKKPAIYTDEQAERATKERLAALLMFPKTAVHFADVEQKSEQGKLYEMPSAVRLEAQQSLRILPA